MLKKLTTGREKSNYDTIDSSSRKQLDSLLKAKKTPDYVRDIGKFYFKRKYNGGTVDIQGYNVRLRSQPNSHSSIVAEGWNGMCGLMVIACTILVNGSIPKAKDGYLLTTRATKTGSA